MPRATSTIASWSLLWTTAATGGGKRRLRPFESDVDGVKLGIGISIAGVGGENNAQVQLSEDCGLALFYTLHEHRQKQPRGCIAEQGKRTSSAT